MLQHLQRGCKGEASNAAGVFSLSGSPFNSNSHYNHLVLILRCRSYRERESTQSQGLFVTSCLRALFLHLFRVRPACSCHQLASVLRRACQQPIRVSAQDLTIKLPTGTDHSITSGLCSFYFFERFGGPPPSANVSPTSSLAWIVCASFSVG